jgi:acyl-CoA synthetase (AMP-forming)/AMP-acid ligase II
MNVLESLYVGALCVVLSPTAFLQRPLSWLRMIHNYRAEIACAPNFAYDLCVARLRADQMQDVDLSCWKKAECGAEPVRAATLEQFAEKFAPYGFDAKSMYPGYGMAESTLLISIGPGGRGIVKRSVSRQSLQRNIIVAPSSESDTQVLVGNGVCITNEEIAVVDPSTLMRLPADRIGEIWVRGPHVAQGYWNNPSATAATFQARILGEGGETWLRTGDLGFLDAAAELFITGRIKDLIIIYGTNHYPQDIEITMQAAHPALRKDCGAAFSIVDARGEEKLVVVQEVERTQRNKIAIDEVEGRIREAVGNEHDVAVYRIALIRPGSLPKTTSGKVQRSLARQLWQDGALELISPAADTARV